MEKMQVRISVRNLVEFILRSGDLDNRTNAKGQTKAMLEGGRVHRKLQKQMKGDYKAEVFLSLSLPLEGFELLLEGRADGIFTKEMVYIDEIKGTYQELDSIKEANSVHLSQAKCYAYMWARQEKLEKIGVRMTYAQLGGDELRFFWSSYEIGELEEWFFAVISAYQEWILLEREQKEYRDASIRGLSFPFPYRKGQRDLVAGVYRSIEKEKILLAQAPTGIGKTMSVLYPAIRAMEEGRIEKAFYLTAKTSTGQVAKSAVDILRKQGLKIKSLRLTAKEKICCNEEMNCNPIDCPYAKGHFDRINEAVFSFLKRRDSFDEESIRAYAKERRVCPFELALDLSLWVDLIICDYNYAFDPDVYLKRFFGEGKRADYAFLVDEAHNLADRARTMYSASLKRSWFVQAKERLKKISKRKRSLMTSFSKAERLFDSLKEGSEAFSLIKTPDLLFIALLNLSGRLEEWMENAGAREDSKWLLDFYFALRRFLKIGDFLDENYVVYREEKEDGDIRIKLYCLNPARNMQNCFNRAKSVILFSATFYPLFYYQALLTEDSEPYSLSLSSPFDEKNRLLLIGGDVTTLYKRRNAATYDKIANYIQKIVWQKKGNYMVFFTSYDLLKSVGEIYREAYNFDGKDLVFQTDNMTEEDRRDFLERFESEEGNRLGFCIMGGIFGEGIDLVGDKLIGAIICGTGLPMISKERELLRNHYQSKFGQGFDYAYRYPGMNKVLQSAGRVIRREEDRGVIVLLDERFLQKEYEPLFPREWEGRISCNMSSLEKYLADFWKSSEEEKNSEP